MFPRTFLICALLFIGAGASDVPDEVREIQAKYRHATAVVKAWSTWQERLYERAQLLEYRQERREKRAKAEREAFAEVERAFEGLRAIR